MSDNPNESFHVNRMEVFKDDNHRVEKPEAIVRRVVEKKYPKLSYEKTSAVVNELVTKPRDEKIRVADEDIRVDTLTEYVADMIEKMNASESDGGDSSLSEYFQWIESGQNILSHMNDGFVSYADLEERNALLKEFEQREVDLMTCISLYRRCNLADPRVKKKYTELNRKLVKLREIRSAITTSTKDKVDEKKAPSAENSEEKKRNAAEVARDGALAMVYAGVLTRLGQEVMENKSLISDEQKRALNIYFEPHVNDQYVLSSIQRDLERQDDFQESLAERLLQKRTAQQDSSLNATQMRLAELSGRVQNADYVNRKTVDVRNRTFDMNRYMMLRKKEELEYN